MYALKLPQKILHQLYIAREYLGLGPIAVQVRNAVEKYLATEEKRLGCSLQDAEEAILEHEKEDPDR